MPGSKRLTKEERAERLAQDKQSLLGYAVMRYLTDAKSWFTAAEAREDYRVVGAAIGTNQRIDAALPQMARDDLLRSDFNDNGSERPDIVRQQAIYTIPGSLAVAQFVEELPKDPEELERILILPSVIEAVSDAQIFFIEASRVEATT